MESFIQQFGPIIAIVVFIIILVVIIRRSRKSTTSYSFKNKSARDRRNVKDYSGHGGIQGDRYK